MSTFSSQVVPTLGIMFTLAIGTQAPHSLAIAESHCGPLVRWKLPETMVVDRTTQDDRTAGVLMTQARLDAIILAAEAYCRLNDGKYPRTFEEMMIGLPGMTQCALDALDVSDAWDRPIFYAWSVNHPVLQSAGADGQFTTADDIGWPKSSDLHIESFDIPSECRGP